MTVDVVLPVLDEAGALPWVLGRLPDGFEPIVVDNGSRDGSGEIAARLGARVVVESQRGFGAACYAGLTAATADVVAFMDCDASLDPAQLSLVLSPVWAGEADMVIGARRPMTFRSMSLRSRLANRYLARAIRRRCGIGLTDLGPMRAASRTGLLSLGLVDRRSGWPLEMVLRAAEAGWRMSEVEVDYVPRTGRSKVTGTALGTARAVADMRRQLRAVRFETHDRSAARNR